MSVKQGDVVTADALGDPVIPRDGRVHMHYNSTPDSIVVDFGKVETITYTRRQFRKLVITMQRFDADLSSKLAARGRVADRQEHLHYACEHYEKLLPYYERFIEEVGYCPACCDDKHDEEWESCMENWKDHDDSCPVGGVLIAVHPESPAAERGYVEPR